MHLTRSVMTLGLILALTTPLHAHTRQTGYHRSSSALLHVETQRKSNNGFSKPPAMHSSRGEHGDDRDERPVSPAPSAAMGFSKPAPPPVAHQEPPASMGFSKPAGSAMGFSKPGGAAPVTGSTMGFTKPGQQPGAASPQRAQQSAADTAIARGQSKATLAQFDADQRKYRAPPVAAPATPQAAQQSTAWRQYGHWRSADEYYIASEHAQQRLPPRVRVYYTSPPVWVAQGPPSYGAYRAAFLGAVLGGAGVAAYDHWAYSHWDDPGVVTWRRSMAEQAPTDPDVQAQLDTLNAKVAELQAQHAPISDAVPDDIDPSLVVAPQTVMAATAHEGINWWLWIPLTLVLLGAVFVVLCISVSRRRQRFA